MKAQTADRRRWLVPGFVAFSLDVVLLAIGAPHQIVSGSGPTAERPRVFAADSWWNGGNDGSVVEIFGQVQMTAAAVLLILAALKRLSQAAVLGMWGCVFLVITVDDYFMLHERAGRVFSSTGPEVARVGFHPEEVGALLFWAMTGACLGAGLLIAHRSSLPRARRESWALGASLAPLAMLAVVYNLVGAFMVFDTGGQPQSVLDFVRTAVKLLTMTLIYVQALRITVPTTDDRRPSL